MTLRKADSARWRFVKVVSILLWSALLCLVAVRDGGAQETNVDSLIQILHHQYDSVQVAAIRALGEIGPAATEAVGPLAAALKSDSSRVRYEAVLALHRISAEEAVEPLIKALKDREDSVRSEAALALVSIADKNLAEGRTDLIPQFEEAYSILIEGGFEENQIDSLEHELNGLRALHQLEEGRVANEFRTRLSENQLIVSIAVFYLLLLPSLLFLILWRRPLWILKINEWWILSLTLPKEYIGVDISVGHVIFVGFLHYHPRVLDAWVAYHLPSARKNFEEQPTVEERAIHIELPVDLNGEVGVDLTAERLQKAFDQKIVIAHPPLSGKIRREKRKK